MHEELRIAQARRPIAAGRVVPLADIARWADRLGTEDELPLPRAKGKKLTHRPGRAVILSDEAAESLGAI